MIKIRLSNGDSYTVEMTRGKRKDFYDAIEENKYLTIGNVQINTAHIVTVEFLDD